MTQGSRSLKAPVVVLRACAVLLLVLAVAFVIGGWQLSMLGGSWYYLIAGACSALAATLLWLRRESGVWIYGATVIATITWAIWEAGFDGWALLPRVGVLVLLATIVGSPFASRAILWRRRPRYSYTLMAVVAAIAIGGLLHHVARTQAIDPMYEAGVGQWAGTARAAETNPRALQPSAARSYGKRSCRLPEWQRQ